MIRTRRKRREYQRRFTFCPGFGTLGCTATQVHAKVVTRQLQTMFQIVRQLLMSVQDDAERSSMTGIGSANPRLRR